MIQVGRYNTLKVVSAKEHGFYLEGDDVWNDILLPQKYAPDNLRPGDDIKVFIYLDSDDLIIATTLTPLAVVGEFALLKVTDVSDIGVFLDWGLPKDLFVPFREQIFEMLAGQTYLVYLYQDSTDRICASTRINKFTDKDTSGFTVGEAVNLIISQQTDLGFKAIVNNKYLGLIFKDDLVNNIKVGDSTKGTIKNIREDGKLDLSIRSLTKDNKDQLANVILEKLKLNDGYLNISSKTSAEEVNSLFNTSRSKFKIALGYLYKKKLISTGEDGTRLL